MIRGRVLQHVGWNLMGTALPALAGLLAMPILARGLDSARLGAFTLALAMIGLSGLLDFGLGRALTRFVATRAGSDRTLAAAGRVIACLGIAGGILGALLAGFAPGLARALVGAAPDVVHEFTVALRCIAIALPFALAGAGLAGVLEGLQRFAHVNAVRGPMNALLLVGPAIALAVTRDLGWLVAIMAGARICACLAWWAATPALTGPVPKSPWLGGLLRFGGWLGVSNVVGPLMVYGDRFFLATMFAPGTLALYTVPLDAVSRASALPAAAANATYPHLARAKSSQHAAPWAHDAGKLLLVAWFLPIAIAAAMWQPLLVAWLGASFASTGAVIVAAIAVGVFLNGCAHFAMADLHAHGRSDLSARLHLVELPVYLALLLWLTKAHGLAGAAVAWAMRVALDTMTLYLMCARLDASARSGLSRLMGGMIVASFVIALLILRT